MPKYVGRKALEVFIQGVRDKYCMLSGHDQVAAEISGTDFSVDSVLEVSMENYMQGNYSNYASLKYVPDEVMEFASKNYVSSFCRTFNGCAALVDIPRIDTSKAVNFTEMFNGCAALKGEFVWPISLTSVDEPHNSNDSPLSNMFAGTGITQVTFVGVPDFAYAWLNPGTLAGSGNTTLKTICVDGTILYME